MKKVTAFIGTQAKKATYLAVQEFEKNLRQYEKIEFEYVFLNDYHLEFCRSCLQCFMKGEEYCPSKDDRDVLLKKIWQSDGIIFATPNYAFQVSARMKNFIDRLSFIYHRPRFFGMAFTAIVTQGVFGGNGVLKYLSSVGQNLGFHVSKGCCVTTLRPMTKTQRLRLAQETKKAAARFYKTLYLPMPKPSFFGLVAFRLARTNIKHIDKKAKDYQYYKKMGWFESDFFYPTNLGPVKKLWGKIFDLLALKMVEL